MLKMQLKIYGQVQPMQFALKVQAFVESLEGEIGGHLKGEADGHAELVVEGEIEELKQIHKYLMNGSHGYFIREIEEDFQPIKKKSFNGFHIYY